MECNAWPIESSARARYIRDAGVFGPKWVTCKLQRDTERQVGLGSNL